MMMIELESWGLIWKFCFKIFGLNVNPIFFYVSRWSEWPILSTDGRHPPLFVLSNLQSEFNSLRDKFNEPTGRIWPAVCQLMLTVRQNVSHRWQLPVRRTLNTLLFPERAEEEWGRGGWRERRTPPAARWTARPRAPQTLRFCPHPRSGATPARTWMRTGSWTRSCPPLLP